MNVDVLPRRATYFLSFLLSASAKEFRTSAGCRHPLHMRHLLNTVSRMSALAASVGLILGLSVAPCYAGKVQSWIGKDADFTRYKTYQWLPVRVLTKTGVIEDDEVAAPLIRQAVNRQLALRGLREVQEGGDLQISAAALSESIPQLEAVIFPAGFASLDYAQPIGTIGRYNREGTLAINLIITGTKQSAWFGLAKESIDNKPGAGLKKIDKAAANLFKKYPVKSIK